MDITHNAPVGDPPQSKHLFGLTPMSIPSLSDPRWPFALILTLYGILGFTLFGFNRTPLQMFLIVSSGALLDVTLSAILKRRWVFPLSAYISCCSLALLLNYSHQNWLLFLPVYLTVGSKYVLTFKGRHVFNPSMFGVATSLLLAGDLITTAPAYQWAGGEITMTAFIFMAALVLFFFKIQKTWLVASFLFFYAIQTAIRAVIMKHHIPPEMLFIGTIASPPFFIFTFYMITDPATSPKSPKAQVLFALVLTLVDLYLHVFESVFTFFYAALIMAGGKYLWLHGGRLFKVFKGLESFDLSFAQLRAPLVVGALGLTMLSGYTTVLKPQLTAVEPQFSMTKLSPEQTGMKEEIGDVLNQVDERVRHVAKWVLSIGDAVSVGDVDNDGLPDLFFSHILNKPGDRAVLYRNLGELRFERIEIPALDRYNSQEGLQRHGAVAGATLVDYDGDGDEDIMISVVFGPPLLLRNELIESKTLSFTDVTAEVGLDQEHQISLAATFFDYDRDAKLDLFVANALLTHFDEYEPPKAFNFFSLPPAEYEGDRRALRFMHNGWHNADNGGKNALYHNENGRFAKQDFQLNETRWSLAVCSGDFNRDGWTDLYVANDFGPDRVYFNREGKAFESLIGESYGEIGKDTYKGMNCSAGDFDNNGFEDIYISNVHQPLQAEGSILWMISESEDPFLPTFSDQATQRNALNERRFAWGAGAGDLNNDGWLDIVQANGMLSDKLDPMGYKRKDYLYVNHKLMQSGPEMHTYADMWGDIRGRTIFPDEARRALLNLGENGPGYFVDVAKEIGIDDPNNSRGVALVDLDRDGDLDLVVCNQHGETDLYRNELRSAERQPADRHYIVIELEGDGITTHRSAIGSKVTIKTKSAEGQELTQIREVRLLTGLSSQGQNRQLHFGLGAHSGPVQVEVQWYGGETQELSLAADAYHRVSQETERGSLNDPHQNQRVATYLEPSEEPR